MQTVSNTTDLPTLVRVYIELGDGMPGNAVAEGDMTPEQAEGWTLCRDVLRDIAEEAHGLDEFAAEYRRQQNM